MRISLLNRRTDVAPRVVETDWGGIEAMLSTSRGIGLTAAEYGKLNKAAQGAMKDGPAWIPGELVGERCDQNMRSICALVFDFDELHRRDVERLWEALWGYRGFAHTSASHTDEAPKWRVMLPLVESVAANKWTERWLGACAWLGLKGRLKPDQVAKNPSRLFYLPTNLSDVAPLWHRLEGKPFDMGAVPGRPAPPPRRALPIATAWWSDDLPRQARNYLKKMGPAVEGASGDNKTYQAACVVVRDFALPESQAFELLREWNASCEPPWSDEELLAKIRHALRYGTSPMGTKRNAFHHGGIDRAAVEAFFNNLRGRNG